MTLITMRESVGLHTSAHNGHLSLDGRGVGGDIGLVRDKYLDVQLIFKHQYYILLLILDRRL